MRDIHCPKDIGFENTFSGEDCEKEQHYNNCYHCWSTALAKGKELEQEHCDDAISRAYIEPIIEELENIYVNGDEHILNLLADIKNAPSVTSHITPTVLADALMEERIRGKLDSDTTFEKDIIRDVKCRLTVSIIDHRPCYCGAELREVWRESEEKDADSD